LVVTVYPPARETLSSGDGNGDAASPPSTADQPSPAEDGDTTTSPRRVTTTSTSTTSTLPLPSGEVLQRALLTASDYGVFGISMYDVEGRGFTLDASAPDSTTICEGVDVHSTDVADDVYKVFQEGVLSPYGVGSEATSFYSDGASNFLDDVTAAADRCPGWRLRSSEPPEGADRAARLVYTGNIQEGVVLDTGTPQIDRVYVQKGNVVIQVVMLTDSGTQSVDADTLAATAVGRLS
jgi:hypothetical protein